jgi:hypothetical protein
MPSFGKWFSAPCLGISDIYAGCLNVLPVMAASCLRDFSLICVGSFSLGQKCVGVVVHSMEENTKHSVFHPTSSTVQREYVQG